MATYIARSGSYWGLTFNVGDKIDAAGRYTYAGEDEPSKKGYRRVLVVDASDGKTKSRTLQGIISQSHKSGSVDKSWDRKKRNAKLFQPGDEVGPNGVIFVSYYDEDGELIPPTASGGRCGLFECVCGNKFIYFFLQCCNLFCMKIYLITITYLIIIKKIVGIFCNIWLCSSIVAFFNT